MSTPTNHNEAVLLFGGRCQEFVFDLTFVQMNRFETVWGLCWYKLFSFIFFYVILYAHDVFDCVGQPRRLAGPGELSTLGFSYVGHSLWDTLVGHSCGALL